MTDTLIQALTEALGAASVLTHDAIPARQQTDWSGAAPVVPLALLRPTSTDQVAAAMRLCHGHGVAVVPQGGMTGLAGGAVPGRNTVALSLERMNTIEAVDTAGGTLGVQAGATLQAVQQAAGAAGYVFGVDLGARGSCQIGGNIATNAGGNGVVQFGMMREQTLGLEVVLADGTVLDMLRPMLKNNTGYDLKQFFIGAEGTLGIVTRAVLKLHPAPRARVTAMVALADYGGAIDLLRQLKAAFPGGLAAFELMWADFMALSIGWGTASAPFAEMPPYAVIAELTGADEAQLMERLQALLEAAMADGQVLDAVVAQSQAQAAALWRIREATAEFPSRLRPINFDVSLPIAAIDRFAQACIEGLSARWPQHRSVRFGHLGDGNLHLTTDARSLGELSFTEAEEAVESLVYGLLEKAGGSISAEHGIGVHKKRYLGLSRSPQELAAMQAIKRALDPRNLLNPGKIFDLSAASEKPPGH